MNILALDTADQVLSVALSAEAGVWYTEIDAGSRHSELLMECVDGLFKTAGLSPAALNLVACMSGPGSFTGLRIGFSAAKGLSVSLGIPLVTAPTLDCLAYTLSAWPGIVLPAIDAKKGCFFAALYRGEDRLTDYLDIAPEALAQEISKARISLEPVLLTGTGAELLFSRLTPFLAPEHMRVSPESRRGRAKELLEIIKNDRFRGINDINSGPVYLRKSDAELNWS